METQQQSLPRENQLNKNIYGIPGKVIIFVGIFTFYILLFFVISLFTGGTQIPENQRTTIVGTDPIR